MGGDVRAEELLLDYSAVDAIDRAEALLRREVRGVVGLAGFAVASAVVGGELANAALSTTLALSGALLLAGGLIALAPTRKLRELREQRSRLEAHLERRPGRPADDA